MNIIEFNEIISFLNRSPKPNLGKGHQANLYRVRWKTYHDVALKAYHTNTKSRSIQKEIDALLTLERQKGIPSLLEYNISDSEERWILIDYIEGSTLSEKIKRAMPLGHAMNLWLKLCRILSAAHELKTYHLDLTPKNIIIDHDGNPFIIDWALSSIGNSYSDGSSGSYMWMAPERNEGRGNGASDVYSLVGILVWLLTELPPHITSSNPKYFLEACGVRNKYIIDGVIKSFLGQSFRFTNAGEVYDYFVNITELT